MSSVLPSINRIAQVLGGDVNGDGVLCPGPGHSDADRSLSVKPDASDAEGFIVNSFSGDDWQACRAHVRKKLGLPEPEHKKKRKSGGDGKWQTLAEHIYRDQEGKPYLKVRKCIDPKGERQFPQFHWDGSDWKKGKPVPKIPYRLPQLLAAPLTSGVWFCEGEKDADNVAKLGFVATTASEGAAAKWDAALTPHFKARHVVILPDADEPGRKHAQKVAKAINAVAASVRILDLYPERNDGSDVSDWIEDDRVGAKLAKLVREAPLWEPPAEPEPSEPEASDVGVEIARLAKLSTLEQRTWRDGLITARELQTKQFKPVRIILPNLIPEGVTVLAGKPKIGKSFLALDVCIAVAAGRFVLGETKPVEGDALYLALEDSQRRLKKRMDKLMQMQAWPERLELHTGWKRVDQSSTSDAANGRTPILPTAL